MLELLKPANIFAPFAISYPIRPLAKSIVVQAVGCGGPRCVIAGSDEGQAMLTKLHDAARMTFQADGYQKIYARFTQGDETPNAVGTLIVSGDIDTIRATIRLASVDEFRAKTWSDGPWTNHTRPVSDVWHDTAIGWYGDTIGVNYVDTLPALEPSDDQTWAAIEIEVKLIEAELPIVQRWEGPIAKRL